MSASREERWRWQRAIRDDEQLSAQGKRCGAWLSLWMSSDGGDARPSIGTLVETSKASESTWHRALRELVAAGWLTAQPRRGKPTTYAATIPPGVTVAPPGSEGVSDGQTGVPEGPGTGASVAPDLVPDIEHDLAARQRAEKAIRSRPALAEWIFSGEGSHLVADPAGFREVIGEKWDVNADVAEELRAIALEKAA